MCFFVHDYDQSIGQTLIPAEFPFVKTIYQIGKTLEWDHFSIELEIQNQQLIYSVPVEMGLFFHYFTVDYLTDPSENDTDIRL